ncbi:hypothetical protein [Azospirillum canadense]|uniref:hypothetical protein n=1 Tax=Azospirillum canadense TaxID=403962 RepID=UPI002227E158|nr:hypothetical protein [Azospirillum canadense]MCW2243593.1 hypothetical protein [Azospirillum canadense]
MPDPNSHDLAQMARGLSPTLAGVVIGMLARWARESREGGWKALVRVVVLDVPSILALTVASGVLAQQLQADTLMACGMGTCAGYAGSEVLKLLLAKLPGGQIDKGEG